MNKYNQYLHFLLRRKSIIAVPKRIKILAIKNSLEDSSTSEVHRFLSSRVLKFDQDRGLIILEDYFLDHFNYINFLIELCKFAKIKGMLKLADGDVRDIYRIAKYDPSGKM